MEQTPNITTYMSASIDQISAALSAFQGSVEQPKLEKEVKVKTKTGGSYSFKYADQLISDGKLVTILSHKSGQWFKSELMLPNQTTDYQAYGSAITYLKRYSYCAILGIVADTDDDANMACGNQADIKDRRATQQATYTEAQLKEALADVSNCSTVQQINAVWGKWQAAAPALCAKGTEFYNAVGAKNHSLQTAAQ